MLKQPRAAVRPEGQRRAAAQERATAVRLGGAVVKGSGCGAAKGDVRLKGRLLVECKTTRAGSFRLTPALLGKIEAEAMAQGELPVIEVEFRGATVVRPGMAGYDGVRICVLPAWALEVLLDRGRAG